MKKIINISLWITIFLLISFICVLSIKKFFDIKQVKKLDNIIATNFIIDFVSINKLSLNSEIEEHKEEAVIVFKEEVIYEESIEIVEKSEVEENETNDIKESSQSLEDMPVLYDGLTEEALITKLEQHLKNELAGTGIKFVEYYKNTGLDPYLATSIVLHETGCTWKCSKLARECFNFGGMKGGDNKYKDTNYSCYKSKEEGINAYLNMLYNNYYAKGLITPELINPKYAASLEWSAAINKYMDKIKNS